VHRHSMCSCDVKLYKILLDVLTKSVNRNRLVLGTVLIGSKASFQ
jgi:hypothetical protein